MLQGPPDAPKVSEIELPVKVPSFNFAAHPLRKCPLSESICEVLSNGRIDARALREAWCQVVTVFFVFCGRV